MNDVFCKDDLERLSKAFVYIVKVYYGLNPENVANEIYQLAIKTICERFQTLKFTELNLAFSEQVIEKRQGVSLTHSELMKPIEELMRKKGAVKYVQDEINEEKRKQEQSKQKEIEFKKESMQIYLDCLERKDGVWTGSEYHASALGRSFADSLHLKPEVKKELWTKAQLEYKERNAKFQAESGLNIGPPLPEVIYSRMIVEYMLTLGVDKTGFPLVVD